MLFPGESYHWTPHVQYGEFHGRVAKFTDAAINAAGSTYSTQSELSATATELPASATTIFHFWTSPADGSFPSKSATKLYYATPTGSASTNSTFCSAGRPISSSKLDVSSTISYSTESIATNYSIYSTSSYAAALSYYYFTAPTWSIRNICYTISTRSIRTFKT
jgi:hypothetical protein